MALSNEDIQEIKQLILETISEETDAIETVQVVDEFAQGDQVPILRSGQGANVYGRASVDLFGGGGGSVVIVNDLTTGGSTKALSAEMGKLLGQRTNALSSTIRISVSFSPSNVVYRGVSQTFTISASISRVTPTTLKILDGSTEIASVSNTQTASVQRTATINAGSKTYDAEAVVYGMTTTDSGVIYARYPIYFGFGAVASDVATTSNRYDPTTTASHVYTSTSSANSVYFFILVPSDIDGLTTFTMGGAPFVMDDETTTQISGVTYKVYKSGVAYNSGVTLSVDAK